MAGNNTLEQVKGNLMKKDDKNFIIPDDTEIVGVYFSAHWCPPCRQFTPTLVDYYNKGRDDGKKFEIIFVSLDRDQKSFDEYYETMPWAAVQFKEDKENASFRQEIAQMNGVSGIPSLVFFDAKSKDIKEKNGRLMVQDNKYDF